MGGGMFGDTMGAGMLGPSGGSMRGSMGSRPTNMRNLAHLFPTRPLLEESRSGDFGFEIQWIVELLEPEAARRTEHPAEPTELPQPDPAEQAENLEPSEPREVSS